MIDGGPRTSTAVDVGKKARRDRKDREPGMMRRNANAAWVVELTGGQKHKRKGSFSAVPKSISAKGCDKDAVYLPRRASNERISRRDSCTLLSSQDVRPAPELLQRA